MSVSFGAPNLVWSGGWPHTRNEQEQTLKGMFHGAVPHENVLECLQSVCRIAEDRDELGDIALMAILFIKEHYIADDEIKRKLNSVIETSKEDGSDIPNKSKFVDGVKSLIRSQRDGTSTESDEERHARLTEVSEKVIEDAIYKRVAARLESEKHVPLLYSKDATALVEKKALENGWSFEKAEWLKSKSRQAADTKDWSRLLFRAPGHPLL